MPVLTQKKHQCAISAPLMEKLLVDLPPNVPLTKAQTHSWEHTLALFSLLPPLKRCINTQCKHQGQVADGLPFESFYFHPGVDPLAIASSLIRRTPIFLAG